MSAAPTTTACKIGGLSVYFPEGKKPFPAQLSVMSKTLAALKHGHNALLESPTGTGKTLSLLTSTLSYQKADYDARLADMNTRTSVSSAGVTSPWRPSKTIRNDCSSPRAAFSATTAPGSPLAAITSDTAVNARFNDKLSAGRQKAVAYKLDLAMKREISSSIGSPLDSGQSPKVSIADSPSASINLKEASSPPRTPAAALSPSRATISTSPTAPRRRRIFYTSRTHSQLSQVTNELRTCSEEYIADIKMAVLGSRTQLCINKPEGASGANVDKHCRDINKSERRCIYRENAGKVANSMRGDVWDIEDVARKGSSMRGCPYFATKAALVDADVVFAPYNYLVDPLIRESMCIDLSDCIVVFDEAHNIQDSCRDSASLEITYPVLAGALEQLKRLKDQSNQLGPLYKLCSDLNDWFERTLRTLLSTKGFDDKTNVFTGEEVLEMLKSECGLSADTVDVFEAFLPAMNEQNANTATAELKFDDEEQEKEEELGTDVVFMIKKILRTFRFLSANVDSYKLVLKMDTPNELKPRGGKTLRSGNSQSDSMTLFYYASFNLWCLSAAVAFRDMADCTHSVLLTSGTLSPLDSFAGELGTDFPITVETSHVIDTERQLRVFAVTSCNNEQLLGTYINRDNAAQKDAIGDCIKFTSTLSPGGTLVFFSSYAAMEASIARWEKAGVYDNLMIGAENKRISIFKEPKESTELDMIMQEYRDTIDSGQQAIMFAVCRGKISEGIDFANNYARAVLIVGIPFPAARDLKVMLKQTYQDELVAKFHKSAGHDNRPAPLSGKDWYSQQAYRAVNQAVGRCIRHKKDYGAILLCDERFNNEYAVNKLSKWLRSSVKPSRMEDCLRDLRSFYSGHEEFKPTPNYKSSTANCGADNALSVPAMFATTNKSTKSTTIRSIFECNSSCSKDLMSQAAAVGGQLNISASFQRSSHRLSFGQTAPSGYRSSNEADLSESMEMESMASTQDLSILSPLSPKSDNEVCDDVTIDHHISWSTCTRGSAPVTESILRQVTAGWEWKLIGGLVGPLSCAQNIMSEFYSSSEYANALAGQPPGSLMLPLIPFAETSGDLDQTVTTKFFHDSPGAFCYSDGEPIMSCCVRLSSWTFQLTPEHSNILTYTEEWDAEDGVVYGVLRLPARAYRSVLAVKVLAATSVRQKWCGAAWALCDVASLWCKEYLGDTNNKDYIPENANVAGTRDHEGLVSGHPSSGRLGSIVIYNKRPRTDIS